MHLEEMTEDELTELANEVLVFMAEKSINCPGCLISFFSGMANSIFVQEK